MKNIYFRLIFVISFVSLAACTEGTLLDGDDSPSIGGGTDIEVSGVVQLGPIKNATVTAYLLNSDGTRGDSVGSAITDSVGAYVIQMTPGLGHLEIVVTGGSYTEEAGGSIIDMTGKEIIAMVSNLESSSQVSVTALTHIAAKRAKKLREEGIEVGAAIDSAIEQIVEASGVPNIMVPPANPEGSILGEDEAARKYALFLAGLSQMASDSGVNSLEASNAFANDFQKDGQFDGSDDGNNVLLGASGDYLGNDDWNADLDTAIDDFIASGDNSAGFQAEDSVDPVAIPVVQIPVAELDPLPPVINDPTFFAIEAPIPFPVGVCVPVNMLILDQYFGITPLSEDSLLINLTPFDPYLAQFFDDPSCLSEIVSAVSVPAGTDMLQLYARINSSGYVDFHNFMIEPLSGTGSMLHYLSSEPIFADPFAPGSMVPEQFELLGAPSIAVGQCEAYQIQFYDILMNPVQIYNGGELFDLLPQPSVYELHTDPSCSSPVPGIPIGMTGIPDVIYIKGIGPGNFDLFNFDIYSYGALNPMPLFPVGMSSISVF